MVVGGGQDSSSSAQGSTPSHQSSCARHCPEETHSLSVSAHSLQMHLRRWWREGWHPQEGLSWWCWPAGHGGHSTGVQAVCRDRGDMAN